MQNRKRGHTLGACKTRRDRESFSPDYAVPYLLVIFAATLQVNITARTKRDHLDTEFSP